MGMPMANADPKPSIRLHIINNSRYLKVIDYSLLFWYLDQVKKYWPIYYGDYYITLGDGPSPNSPPDSGAYHWKGANAYVDVKIHYDFNLDPYIGITHELGEMAVDPNIDYYDKSENLVEICDDNLVMIYKNHFVSKFSKPKHFNL